MADLLSGLIKGITSVMPVSDDPDLKIAKAGVEVNDLKSQVEKLYAKLGRQVMEQNGAEAYPEIGAQLQALNVRLSAAEDEMKALQEAKAAAEKAAAERAAEASAIYCPQCNTKNEQGTRFCQECGAKLEAEAKKFCTGCGAELPPGAKFCGGCGTRAE